MLEVINLSVEIDTAPPKRVLEGVNLSISPGEVCAIMGPNGSGKTSLLYAIMGHPKYRVIEGDIRLDGESILNLPPHLRSLRGLFMTFQAPIEIPGVRLSTLLIAAFNKKIGESDLMKVQNPKLLVEMRRLSSKLGLGREFLRRDVNVGFSGGERKKSELLQALILKPKYMILDEPDTGLDIDSVKNVASFISKSASEGVGVLLVTHYARILNYVTPSKVGILVKGKLVDFGGPELAELIEHEGYARYGVVEVDRSN